MIIIGANALQNDLMASFLEKETAIRCFALGDDGPQAAALPALRAQQLLLLFDGMGATVDGCLAACPPWIAENNGPCRVCLFNLNPFSGLEPQLLFKGIRGFFYRDAPLQHLAKGIQAVFNGELWVSRKAMIELLTRRGRDLPQSPPNTLSTREADIMAQVVEGATNRTIAAALGLSPHTVKTHLYNIFKKINVRSRHQAALWAHRHL